MLRHSLKPAVITGRSEEQRPQGRFPALANISDRVGNGNVLLTSCSDDGETTVDYLGESNIILSP